MKKLLWIVALPLLFGCETSEQKNAEQIQEVEALRKSRRNEAPTVSAGADKAITLPQNSLSLTASASDPDGTISSYLWSKVSGPAATLSSTSSAVLSLSNLIAGSYVFKVVVKDNAGASANDSVSVTVNPTVVVSPVTGATCSNAKEGTSLSISCASGFVVTEIKFASYGLPSGSCGSYAKTSCHSSTSESVVKSACLNKASCSVEASNDTFGDPCPTFGKELLVEYKCAASSATGGGTVTPPPPAPEQPVSSGSIGPQVTTFAASGPIKAVSGQVIQGLHITNPNGPCIEAFNVSNVVIKNNKIGPCGPTTEGVGVSAYQVSNITVINNHIEDIASGFYATSSSNNLVFEKNIVKKVRGPFPRGQMVQFNTVIGSGNKIRCNISDSAIGGYNGLGPEDHINMYRSSGTSSSPTEIAYNKIRGGGPSMSGGGILLGDDGGSYNTAHDNILVDPGQYGISISSGIYNRLLNNKVYASQNPWTNNGAFVWNQYPSECANLEVRGNKINYTHRDGYLNAGWNGGGCGTPAGWSENLWSDNSVTPDIWNTVFDACK